jgi:hypothetical protein
VWWGGGGCAILGRTRPKQQLAGCCELAAGVLLELVGGLQVGWGFRMEAWSNRCQSQPAWITMPIPGALWLCARVCSEDPVIKGLPLDALPEGRTAAQPAGLPS